MSQKGPSKGELAVHFGWHQKLFSESHTVFRLTSGVSAWLFLKLPIGMYQTPPVIWRLLALTWVSTELLILFTQGHVWCRNRKGTIANGTWVMVQSYESNESSLFFVFSYQVWKEFLSLCLQHNPETRPPPEELYKTEFILSGTSRDAMARKLNDMFISQAMG